jgi:predicted ArsR family transcriptional regulator
VSEDKAYEVFLGGSRGRLLGLLRRGGLTVDQIAADLGVSANAVRVQLGGMERRGLVRRGGLQRGATRPSRIFELTPEVEQLLSRAYTPMLVETLQAFASRLPPDTFDDVMRQVGRALALQLDAGAAPTASPAQRIAAASELLNRELGASTEVQRSNGHYVIRGHGCPLSAVTGKHRGVCLALESLLEALVRCRVQECCSRRGRPSCCFTVECSR